MSGVFLNTTLAILAGGEGSRMGRPKSLLTLGGKPILSHILGEARWNGPTMLVTSPGRQFPPAAGEFSFEVSDPVADQGPMRGVLTALQHSVTDQVVVSAVDMPSTGSEIFSWLARELSARPHADAVMIERKWQGDHIVEPLPAAFRKSAQTLLEQRLAEGKRSLYPLAHSPGVEVLLAADNWIPELWTNLNSPGDLAKWKPAPSGLQ
jgi:molybdopterin-guanine dinucleotide biosynthesis protein A